MTGQQVIDFIKENNLENAPVSVTATMYYPGDHDCRTTTEVSIGTTGIYDDETKEYVKALDFYVDSELY